MTRGRPRAKVPRDRSVTVRLTEAEYVALLARAGEGSATDAARGAIVRFARDGVVPCPFCLVA